MMMERLWIVVAALLVIVAAAFLWRNNVPGAFVTATLGAVAWFLSYRAQIRARLAATDTDPGDLETNEDSHEK